MEGIYKDENYRILIKVIFKRFGNRKLSIWPKLSKTLLKTFHGFSQRRRRGVVTDPSCRGQTAGQ